MDTIILSDRMPSGKGGRPTNFGSLIISGKGNGLGVFIGYATVDGKPYRVGVHFEHFEQAIPRLGMSQYKITLNYQQVGEQGKGFIHKLLHKKTVHNLPSYEATPENIAF